MTVLAEAENTATSDASNTRALAVIFVTILINMIGFGVIMPVMPDLIMEVTGRDRAHAAQWGGYLSLSYAVMQFLMMPVLGGLSDQFGRRPIILGSLIAYSIDFLLMALAPTVGILLLARTLAGCFSATFSTANAYIADISPPEKRAANFGLMGAAFGLGFIIGPAIGGFVGEAYGSRAPFYVVAALGLVNVAFGWFMLKESLPTQNRRAFDWRRANAFGNFQHFRKHPVILPIAGALLLIQLAHWTFPSVWSYYAGLKFDWSVREIGYSLMAVGIASAIVQGGLSRVAIPKLGEARAAFFSLSIAILCYFAYGAASEGWMIYAIIAVGALGGFAQPAIQSIMSRSVASNAQGELQGAIAAVNGVSMIVGPWLMTQVFAAFSDPGTPISIVGVDLMPNGVKAFFPGAPFVLAGALTLIALAPLAVALKRDAARQRAPV